MGYNVRAVCARFGKLRSFLRKWDQTDSSELVAERLARTRVVRPLAHSEQGAQRLALNVGNMA